MTRPATPAAAIAVPCALLLVALLLAACTSSASNPPSGSAPTGAALTTQPPSSSSPAPSSPAPTQTTPPPPLLDGGYVNDEATGSPALADPVISPIDDQQWTEMVDTGIWRPGCPAGRKDLRRLDINYVNFDGEINRGALVANRDAVDDLSGIFTALFDAGFPIDRMRPVEAYDGDVDRSLRANNTSAFNCRKPDQINAPVLDSPHANGRAIDINPYQNPWTDPRCDCWMPSDDFAAARIGAGVIIEDSLPWRLFTDRGWIWQDIKVPDFMHFDTGFPSRPRP